MSTLAKQIIGEDEDLRRIAHAGGFFPPYRDYRRIRAGAQQMPEYNSSWPTTGEGGSIVFVGQIEVPDPRFVGYWWAWVARFNAETLGNSLEVYYYTNRVTGGGKLYQTNGRPPISRGKVPNQLRHEIWNDFDKFKLRLARIAKIDDIEYNVYDTEHGIQ